jgi:hypothetical protein
MSKNQTVAKKQEIIPAPSVISAFLLISYNYLQYKKIFMMGTLIALEGVAENRNGFRILE